MVIAYIPALHSGYLEFFKKYPSSRLFILGNEFVKEQPRLDRDIRALEPETLRQLIEALHIFQDVRVLDGKTLDWVKTAPEKIIMPDEDISRSFAAKYLANKEIEFVQTFLRWDMPTAVKEVAPKSDRVISSSDFDRIMMDVAATEAKKSPDWYRQIGAIIVKDKKPILIAHNSPLPSEYSVGMLGDPRSNFDAGERIDLSKFVHAEAGLIAEAAKRGMPLEDTSLYVTTFPCPVCAKSVALAGIKRVYYRDGYSLLDAEDILKKFGVEIILVK